ncbi:MAG: ABC transporter permease [Chloroflexota bacterium]|nr:ABC transporter permease [Chloroflexota bacterium]
MTQYIIRRILFAIPVLLAVALVTFALVRALPGGPFDFEGDRSLPPSVVANLEAKYHLSDPTWQQFCSYLLGDDICRPGKENNSGKGLIRGDLGPSLRYRSQTVNDIIGQALPVSAQLGFLAVMLGLFIGLPAGIISALKQNTVWDYTASTIAILGVSINNIVLAPLLIWVFALQLGWFPAARWGARPPFFLFVLPPMTSEFWTHAVLPVVALGTALSGSIARLTRASLLQVIREDYIRTARSKGLRERTVVVRHGLKNSLIPVVTILGPMFAAVLTGTFVIERIFAIPGLGKHFIESVGNRDYPVVLGTTLIFGIAIVVANLSVDILYAWLDPRIRYD